MCYATGFSRVHFVNGFMNEMYFVSCLNQNTEIVFCIFMLEADKSKQAGVSFVLLRSGGQ